MVRALKIIVFLTALAGIRQLRFGSDISSFNRTDAFLAEQEMRFAQAMKVGSVRIVELDSWQRRNAELKSMLGEVKGEFLTAEGLPPAMSFESDGVVYAVLPSENGIDFRAELDSIFSALARESYILLAFSLALLMAVLAVFFRWRIFVYVMPIAASVIATAGMLGWLGERAGFFHLLCFFVLTGLGIDYTIFHRDGGDARARRVVRYSFLTSLIGFGMLAFTSFPVTAAMGRTFAFGLFFAWFFSLPPADRRATSAPWYLQKEQSAGTIRIMIVFWIYRIFSKTCAKIAFLPAFACIYPFCHSARAALKAFSLRSSLPYRPFRQMLHFAFGVIDKTDACSLAKNRPEFTFTGDTGWMKGGAFLLSSHMGTIEVLPAVDNVDGVKVHAFQQMGHNAIYTRIFSRYMDRTRFTLHAVEDIGVETAVEMKEAIGRGELVLMAADRLSAGSGAYLTHPFFGADAQWPKGVFRFAKLMDCPVYAIIAVRTGWNRYEVSARRLGERLLPDYVAFLEEKIRQYPLEYFQF